MLNQGYLKPPVVLSSYGLGVPPDTQLTCPMCHTNEARIFYNAHPNIRTNQVFPCEKCEQVVETKDTRYYEKTPTSLWKDPKGKEVAVDQRGNTFESPYKNRKFDRHGWLQTHKRAYKKTLQRKGHL